MKKPVTLLFSLLVTIGLALPGCSGSTGPANELGQTDALTFPEGRTLAASFTDSRLSGMKGVAESDRLQLFVNDQTAEIAVLDKKNGTIWRSNPPDRDADPIASGVNKDLLSAQTRIIFYNMYGQVSSVNSYTDSVAHQQMAFEMIPDGIRVTYQFGKADKTIDNMPQMISKARFEELLGRLDRTNQRALVIAYKEDAEKGVYVRNDGALKGFQLQRALDALEAAGYTEEDLMQDIAENQLNQTLPIPRIFRLSMEYILDGDSLVVKVPVSSIHYPENYPVNSITLLDFFGAGGPDEQGSLFVPDGSGALIHFNNGKSIYPAYQQDVYGQDLTLENTDFLAKDEKIRLPVFGVIKKDGAFLSIIEQGASVARINADVSGRLNSYNYVYPSFYVLNKDEVTLRASDQRRRLPKFQEEPMKTDYVVRYVFLSGEEASYQGMAKYYQQYLAERGMLPQKNDDSNKDVPFYLQLIGSIDKKKHVLGVPYQALEPLTTLKEAEMILEELKKRNIRNINLKYAGWFNGGLNHQVPKTISVDRAIGGTKGLADFLAFVKQEGIAFYPDIALLSVNSPSGFRESKEAARRLTEEPAAVYPMDQALNRRDRDRTPSYVLSPRLVGNYVDAMLEDLADLEIDSLSLRDLADQLNSDYRKNRLIDRTESEGISVQAMKRLREQGLNLVADGGNAYALPYLSTITNAPLSSSRFKIEDEEIPFYQMVIRGYLDYTGAPFNLSTYTNARQYMLKCLEYGANLYFTWIYEPNYKVKDTEYDDLYAVHYREWIDLAEDLYHEVNEVLKHVKGQRIISHKKLADGVFKTLYENGYFVIVNYNDSSVTADGWTIEAESFVTGGERS